MSDANEVTSIVASIISVLILISLIALPIVAIKAIIKALLKKKCEKIIWESSKRINDLIALNDEFRFNQLSSIYTYKVTLDSKRNFDRFDFDDYFEELIEEDIPYFANLREKFKENNELSVKYENKYLNISKYASKEDVKKLKLPFRIYSNLERKIANNLCANPVVSAEFIINIYYTSPQGRNSYYNHKTYSLDDLESYYFKVKEREKRKISREHQRRIMTNSLRYDIMKRDGFKCVLCGRSAKEDGVKLHVDHIIPVSKGGKTVPDNLRTLCDSCNIGKRDKYDNQGVN